MSSSSANQPNRPPPAVPEHELLKRIGGGSFGEVWLARNLTTATYRAVKVVYRDKFEVNRAYERELCGIRRFEPVSRTHTGLVDILQVGQNEEQEYFYYVMELADSRECGPVGKGESEKEGSVAETELPPADFLTFSPASYSPRTLHSEIHCRDRLPAEQCIALGKALTDAVAHLHQQGLLHRDIKPANVVFIDGQPKLADIGLVANVAEAGSFVGTRGFIPPEGHVSERSDVFSLGKLLYECAWGKDRLDFPAMPADAAEWPDHALLLELNEVILKSCDHDPACRYGSVEELQADLLLVQQGRSLRRMHRIEGRLKRWARTAAAAAVVAVLTTCGWLYQRHQSQQLQELADENRRQLARSHVTQGVRLLDDGDYLASLPWFVEALRLEQGDPAREGIHRRRIAAVLRQCPKLVAMGLHSKRILYAEFSRDGRRIVTASADGTARVWDAATSGPVTPALRHEGDVVHIAFGGDGRRVVTGSEDKTARLWDATSGQPISNEIAHGHRVYMVGFSPDGRWMATASHDRTARVWNATNAEPVSPSLAHPREVTHAAFSPDGQWLATTCRDQAVRLWDTRTWQPTTLPVKHTGVARQVTFSPDGRRLASTGGVQDRVQNGGEVMLWRVSTAELLLPPMRHAETVYDVSFTPDERWLLTASTDGTARLWDTETGAAIDPVFRQGDSVRSAVFSPDGRRVLTCGLDGVWRVWDLTGALPSSRDVIYLNGAEVHAEFSADGQRVLTCSSKDPPTVWAAPAGSAPKVVFQSVGSTGPACFSIDGHWIAVSDSNNIVRVLDASTGDAVSPPMPHDESLVQLTFSHDGRWLAAIGQRSARIWETRSGRPTGSPLEHRYPIQHGAFSPDGRFLAIGCGDPHGVRKGEILVWSVAIGRPAIPSFAVEGSAIQVVFSPDSRHLLSACVDGTANPRLISILDVAGGGRVVRTLAHPNAVPSVAYSRDGLKIVTSCSDGRARVWNAGSGHLLAQTSPHLRGAHSVTFSPDALLLVTASIDGVVRIWDAATGAPVSPWLKHEGHVWRVEVSADGNRLVSAGGLGPGLGRAQIWDLAGTGRSAIELERLAQALSGCELDAALNLNPLNAETLQATWQQLKIDCPGIVSASAETAIIWHEAQATECERRQQWFAARFHLEWLARSRPVNAEFSERLRRANAALQPRFPNAEEKVREGSLPRTAGE